MVKEKLFEDMTKLASSGASVLVGMRKQIKDEIRSHMDDMAMRMDLVPREDFERLEDMLKEARQIQDEQNKRIETLEKALKAQKGKTASKQKN